MKTFDRVIAVCVLISVFAVGALVGMPLGKLDERAAHAQAAPANWASTLETEFTCPGSTDTHTIKTTQDLEGDESLTEFMKRHKQAVVGAKAELCS